MKKLLFAIFAGFIGLSAVATDTVSDGKIATTVGFVTEQMAPLQDNFPGQSGTKAVTFGTESGENIPRTVTDNMGNSTSDNSLPTAGATKTALDAKQDAVPANDSNSVLTYTGVAGSVGSKGVYQDSGTYAEQMDDLVTAETFNSALANGLNSEFICAEYDPAEPDKCWLWEIRALNPDAKTNYFIMDLIPEKTDRYGSTITRNADGSITISIGRNPYAFAPKLSVLAPGLEVGKRYKLTIDTTGNKYIYLSSARSWDNNQIRTATTDMLNSEVYLYASGLNTTATISSIRIEAAESELSKNLFDINRIPERYDGANGSYIINNHDGTLTVRSTNTSFNCHFSIKKLSALAPGLEIGKQYVFSMKSSNGPSYIFLVYAAPDGTVTNTRVYFGGKVTMTQQLLDSTVAFYANERGVTTVISDIQIEQGSTATSYVPYGAVYLPQNQ